MRSSPWFFSFSLLCSLVLALPLKDKQPLPSLKPYWYSTSPRGVDSFYPSVDARLRRALLTQRRRLQFAWRDTWEYISPKAKPEKIDVFLLRKQEDALFMTPQALFQSLYPHPPPEVGPKPKKSIHPQFFSSFEAEVVKRPTSKRHQVERIFRRRIGAEASEL